VTSPGPAPFERPADVARTEPPFDPQSWSGALIVMALFAGLIWGVQIVNATQDYRLDRFGIKAREVDGLWGLVTMPFLHASYAHLMSNTAPLVLVGWVLLLSGVRVWAVVTGFVVVVGGALTWVAGPGDGVVVGASGMIFGWLGYLLARAYFSRKIRWIVVAVLVLVFFGTLLVGLVPSFDSGVSWQAHVCGFAAGVGVGALLHPRGGEARLPTRSVVS
jgi:membrane associated rhomboid family serine protease